MYHIHFHSQNPLVNGDYHFHDSSHNGRPTFIRDTRDADHDHGHRFIFLYHVQSREADSRYAVNASDGYGMYRRT